MVPIARDRHARKVSGILDGLDAGWTVLRAGRHDVEHVVIGRPGIFAVRIEHTPGKGVWARGETLSTNGRTTSFVQEAVAAARRIRERLEDAAGMPTPVTAVLAFVGAASVSATQPIGDGSAEVRVVRGDDLLAAFNGPAVFSADELDQVVMAARRLESAHARAQAHQPASNRRRRHGIVGAIAAFVRRGAR